MAEIRFNRPDSLNSLDVAMADALATTVERVIADKAVQVVVFSGNGRGFMAGGDLRAFYDTPIAQRLELSRRIISPLNRALSALVSSDILSVSSLHG